MTPAVTGLTFVSVVDFSTSADVPVGHYLARFFAALFVTILLGAGSLVHTTHEPGAAVIEAAHAV